MTIVYINNAFGMEQQLDTYVFLASVTY